jgi:hypothetical protein
MYSFGGGCSNLVARPPAFTYQFNIMSKKKIFTLNQAKTIGEQLGINWDKFDLEQFLAGLGVELEHGAVNQTTDVTNNDPLLTGKIALAHLTEFPDYYTRLAKMEAEAKQFWNSKKRKKTISGSRKKFGNRISAIDSAKS